MVHIRSYEPNLKPAIIGQLQPTYVLHEAQVVRPRMYQDILYTI
jgi:hypothetical protein